MTDMPMVETQRWLENESLRTCLWKKWCSLGSDRRLIRTWAAWRKKN